MNILPKKRWHVRTKENIARVRKDEAEAAEKERQERLRIENADREARLSVLKQKSKQKLQESGFTITNIDETPTTQEHINFFSDIEHTVQISNKEHDKEVKEKKEEYEKKIGYLTYLGQDTNESLGKKNWYEVLPESSRSIRADNIRQTYDKLVLKDKDGLPKVDSIDVKDGEISWKAKQRLDPMNKFKEYCRKDEVKPVKKNNDALNLKSDYVSVIKSKKHKRTREEDKAQKLKKLREARIKREQEEKRKTELFLSKLSGDPLETTKNKESVHTVKQKYNSQFNPEFARQNYT